jgi:hypothetical protein
MKKVYIVSLMICLLLAVSSISLFAQNNTGGTTANGQQTQTFNGNAGRANFDDFGNANNPFTNQRANACYLGGSLAGICDTQWEWECGWGIIRVENGMIPSALLSQQCQALKASPATANVTATPAPTSVGTSTFSSNTSGGSNSSTNPTAIATQS